MESIKYIRWFKDSGMADIAAVGGKNASLGQMISQLAKQGVKVPDGFAVTAQAYNVHLEKNNIKKPLQELLRSLNTKDGERKRKTVAFKMRALIENAPLPKDIAEALKEAYTYLCKDAGENCSVAVRSSATAEDLPNASFAGQQESFLNIRGEKALLLAYKKCLASLFTERAIVYRMDKGFDHFSVALSVGVQRMVRSDKACSGVMFTIDTETGFNNAIVVTASYGLGETIVQGEVVPDEFHIFKPLIGKVKDPLIKKKSGNKAVQCVFGSGRQTIVKKRVPLSKARTFCISDEDVIQLAKYAMSIENHYSALKGAPCPMDIEWAKDGITGELYIVQARPETVHANAAVSKGHVLELYTVDQKKNAKLLVTGQSIGQKATVGKVRLFKGSVDATQVKQGDILVTHMTDPDSVPAMKKAAGIITQIGGRTCHAAIVSRELGVPAIVGAQNSLSLLKNGQKITLDCSDGAQGFVYDGFLPIKKEIIRLETLQKPKAAVLMNMATPERAYAASTLPVDGVGLARLEFIIANDIQVHPLALLQPKKVSASVRTLIAKKAYAYPSLKDFFIQKMAYGVGTIAAAFYPRPVIVRFSDFKSNEYRNLIGGSFFEPLEENPMIGLRGASRYYSPLYQEAFDLECTALRYVRESMGLSNVQLMVPFVRTPVEAAKVVERLKKNGLVTGKNDAHLYMMCEIPSNVILMHEFAPYFDGFSIGSNDLTQTTLAVDRDSELLAPLFDERDPAVLCMIKEAIVKAHQCGKTIGICGQAPSDYPEIATFLLECGIDSLSLNQDSVIPFLRRCSNVKKTDA